MSPRLAYIDIQLTFSANSGTNYYMKVAIYQMGFGNLWKAWGVSNGNFSFLFEAGLVGPTEDWSLVTTQIPTDATNPSVIL